jgi:hypothetical protein
MVIPGEFGCVGDPHADGYVLSLANFLCALGIKNSLGEFTLCAGIKIIPSEQEKWFADTSQTYL